ncbi:response regulator transcription factor [Ralstonia mannitolilytica]|jgi:DNA-binding NarL/FixJ family response regulator|uniref:DNA-binding transcriptional activator DevR/DosR n=1 Tax=Ralstonia mannitolilytica TaxID=105219 RepID=A0AAD2AJE1_9RALS|nr:response regulator transcription factor [Ralstonia mannitolilytica]ATG19154.1 DNA-binding response regulator [Ralstonia pickettii]ANA32705.1 LuxR family transcriptional regulator [Ralstonia mannitolilytica]MBY4718429.1 response regulator transcription factor [Ralstonia mannitolilytica]CAJ0679485.1 DNA-binding transcriptional activator DevR/DosR [Ralstonia mannitolilytica]CAJ0681203.1 DNA-binding transcriptional activator DevR/DosR [Ralstonia mannitolilytica]
MTSSLRSLLVVDDHPLALSGTTTFLAHALPEVQVHAAIGRRQALALVDEGVRPDVVLLDVWLSDCTGFDAMRELRGKLPEARFAFMSAENTPEIVAKAQALGAIGFIGKHADAHAFSKAVAGIFSGDASFPSEDDLGGSNKGGASHGIPITPAELGLTPRQGSVLALLLEGLPNKSIARQLGLTENTVKEHVSAILQRLGVRTRIQIISRMERFRLTGAA